MRGFCLVGLIVCGLVFGGCEDKEVKGCDSIGAAFGIDSYAGLDAGFAADCGVGVDAGFASAAYAPAVSYASALQYAPAVQTVAVPVPVQTVGYGGGGAIIRERVVVNQFGVPVYGRGFNRGFGVPVYGRSFNRGFGVPVYGRSFGRSFGGGRFFDPRFDRGFGIGPRRAFFDPRFDRGFRGRGFGRSRGFGIGVGGLNVFID